MIKACTMKHNASLSVIFFIFSLSLSAVATEVNNASFIAAVEKSITAVKKGEPFRLVDIPLAVTDDSLQLLEKYKKDPSPDVREAALTIYCRIGIRSKDMEVRQRAVDNSVEGIFDSSTLVREHIAKLLFEFSPEDFSVGAKNRLMAAIQTKPDYNVVLAVGVANIQEALPILSEIRTNEVERIEQLMARQRADSGLYQPRWDVSSLYRGSLLASGRMGETDAIEEYIHRVENLEELSTRMYFINLLQYVRQPEVIQFLLKYLDSNEFYGGEGDVVKAYVAVDSAEMLVSMIDGFPSREYLEQEEAYIARCREWVSNNPDKVAQQTD